MTDTPAPLPAERVGEIRERHADEVKLLQEYNGGPTVALDRLRLCVSDKGYLFSYIASLQAEIAALRKALQRVEWIIPDSLGVDGFASCPMCGQYKEKGHLTDCIIAAALADNQGGENT